MKSKLLLMALIMTSVILLALFSCKKDDIKPTPAAQCDCYTQSEKYQGVNNGGVVTLQWVVVGTSQPSPMDCNSASDYVNQDNTHRTKVICN